jgi:hypothetical protein
MSLKEIVVNTLVTQIKSLPESLQEEVIDTTIENIKKEERNKHIKELECIPSLMQDLYLIMKDNPQHHIDLFKHTFKSKLNLSISEGLHRVLEQQEYNDTNMPNMYDDSEDSEY